MKKWNNPEIDNLSLEATAHGDRPAFPLDGEYTDNGLPYGADNDNEHDS